MRKKSVERLPINEKEEKWQKKEKYLRIRICSCTREPISSDTSVNPQPLINHQKSRFLIQNLKSKSVN